MSLHLQGHFFLMSLADFLRQQGITNEAVLAAIAATPRDEFVMPSDKLYADLDQALPIEAGQTISQPYVVARMTELLLGERKHLAKVLEIGTGSGYQAAVLAHLADEVYSVERIKLLYQNAQRRLQDLAYHNVFQSYADGRNGWSEHAPYDAIIVTAQADKIEDAWREQLADDGKLVLPLGQVLQVMTRQGDDYSYQAYDAVMFVPLLSGKE